jgi:AhpD family alkylhydroperoxidase
MMQRIDYNHLAPGALAAMLGVQRYVDQHSIEKPLLELVKLRSSQLNGCAYCVDMHSKDARALGETEQRLYAVAVWREAPFFNERERAALAWTETVTLIAQTGVPDDVYQIARNQFSEKELIDLTMAIIAINGWNRLAVSFRAVAGSYQPKSVAETSGATPKLQRTASRQEKKERN